MERWKEIPNARGLYYVSDQGRVKSLCGRTPRILKQTRQKIKRKCGDSYYFRVRINYAPMKWRDELVHRLVAEAFVPNPEGHMDEACPSFSTKTKYLKEELTHETEIN